MKKLLTILLLCLWTGSAFAAITLPSAASIPSRTSGAAPLAVWFNATATTSTATSRPYHELEYRWNFGDKNAGTWTKGAVSGLSKNEARGPVAFHVFESAGDHTVRLLAYDGSSTAQVTMTITVTAADTQWSGTNTLCVRQTAGGSFSGCPSGADQVTDADFDNVINTRADHGNTYKRVLFECDGTYAASTAGTIHYDGPGYVGAYPAGCSGRAKPIISGTVTKFQFGHFAAGPTTNNADLPDWRLVDLDFQNSDKTNRGIEFQGPARQITMLRIAISNASIGIHSIVQNLDSLNASVPHTYPLWREFALIESVLSTFMDYAVLGEWNSMAVVGNQIDTVAIPPEIAAGLAGHVFRISTTNLAVISNNNFSGPSDRTVVTLRGVNYAGDNTLPANWYTENIVFSDNKLEAGTGVTSPTLPFTIRRVNDTQTDVRIRNVIVERNWLVSSATAGEMLNSDAQEFTFRNNLLDMTGTATESVIALSKHSSTPTGYDTNLNYYNNTVYSASTVTRDLNFIALSNGSDATSPTNSKVQNNLIYIPNWTGTHEIVNSGGSSFGSGSTVGNNTTNFACNPLFATTPPATPTDWRTSSGTCSVGQGTSVPVYSDFFRRAWPTASGSWDRGAASSNTLTRGIGK